MLPKHLRRPVLIFHTMSTLDHVDLELLAALAADPRATVVALAERLGLSRNTVQARMARLERSGVFLSYERAISSTALGFPIEAFISVMVRQADLPRDGRGDRSPRDAAHGAGTTGTVTASSFPR